MDLFEKYQDVLQNIEFAIVSIYREHLEMTDYAVMRSLEAIINHYSAEKTGKTPRNFSLDKPEKEIFRQVQSVCEWRMGRPSSFGMPENKPISLDEIIQCLKRILKSVEKWNKHEGIQGYLRFVSQYVR
ncbi:MAG: hypothetical protein FD159_1989 [Syntrophaceae bacterium]|nr:MAG: hypothetical protein FD159_1989 [Syntrophaceae bacterium]